MSLWVLPARKRNLSSLRLTLSGLESRGRLVGRDFPVSGNGENPRREPLRRRNNAWGFRLTPFAPWRSTILGALTGSDFSGSQDNPAGERSGSVSVDDGPVQTFRIAPDRTKRGNRCSVLRRVGDSLLRGEARVEPVNWRLPGKGIRIQ